MSELEVDIFHRLDGMRRQRADLGLAEGTVTALTKRAGIATVGDLVRQTRTELLAIRGLGLERVDEIKAALAKAGLKLATSGASSKGPT